MLNPIIIVEALSPGTQSVDFGIALRGYFQLSSVQQYLDQSGEAAFNPLSRGDAGKLTTRIISEGEVRLDPPGITLQVVDLFPPE